MVTTKQRWIWLVVIYAILLSGGWLAGQWLPQITDFNVSPRSEPIIHRAIMTTAVIFVLASALPFVPGAEIGFGLIMLFGGRIAFLVYVGMVAALIMAYLVGRLLPLSFVAKAFARLGLKRAHEFVLKLAPLNAQERIALLTENAPRRFVPAMLRYRYPALVLLLNLPGNSIVGGGGGIALVAGMSGLFSLIGFVAAIAIAVAPVPLFFFLTG